MAEKKEPDKTTDASATVEAKPEAYIITAVMEDGKRLQVRSERSLSNTKAEARKIASAGYEIEADGVFTHYPAHRIVRITVIPAAE